MLKKSMLLLALLLGLSVMAGGEAVKPYQFPVPARKPGQKSVLGLRAEPIKNIRVAFIGVGGRGSAALWRFASVPEHVTIKVACDLYQWKLDKVKKMLEDKKYPYPVDYYTGKDDWKKICERDDIDLVYVTTGAGLHTPIAVHAMKNGKHAAVEVPSSSTIAQCWEMVDTAEQTQKHCMILENCNYDEYVLATLNMAQQGLFGIAVAVEGAYLHDMRKYRFNLNDKTNWRKAIGRDKPYSRGNYYPTHGIGPIAHWLGIHRGDRMDTLVSISGGDFSLREAAKKKFGNDDPLARKYFDPDMNMSIIKTAKGKTILLFHATSLATPYSRGYKLYGSSGSTWRYPTMGFAFDPDADKVLSEEETKKLIEQYRHPISKQFQEQAKKFGGHGGMDTVMDLRLIYCLNNGLPLDIDVYDAAEWSAIIEASKKSVELNGRPVEMPDFTRGDWDKLSKTMYYKPDGSTY